jgi:hypothetical protein
MSSLSRIKGKPVGELSKLETCVLMTEMRLRDNAYLDEFGIRKYSEEIPLFAAAEYEDMIEVIKAARPLVEAMVGIGSAARPLLKDIDELLKRLKVSE